MKEKLKIGTPTMGVVIGLGMAGAGALIMWIGFWKALILIALFLIGYFIGTVKNKEDFVRDTANRIIPKKETTVIDLKSEITREQTQAVQATEEKDGEE